MEPILLDNENSVNNGNSCGVSTSDDSEHGNENNNRKFRKRRLMSGRKTRSQVTLCEEESDDSDDYTDKAKRRRAFKAFKETKAKAKANYKVIQKIRERPPDEDVTAESDNQTTESTHTSPPSSLLLSEKEGSDVHSGDKMLAETTAISCVSHVAKNNIRYNGIISDSEEESTANKIFSSRPFIVDESSYSESEDNDKINRSLCDGEDDSGSDSSEVEEINSEWAHMIESLKRRGEKYDELNSQYEDCAKKEQLGGYDVSDDEGRVNKYPKKLLQELKDGVEAAREEEGIQDGPDLEDNNRLIQMWELYNMQVSGDKEGECICGQTGLRFMYFMRIKGMDNWPFYTKIVGSECIKWFQRGNPKSVINLFVKLSKEGSVAIFQQKLNTKSLLFSLGGTIIPQFLKEHREVHNREFILPIKIHDQDGRVDLIVNPESRGRVLDTSGELLKKGNKYHLWARPAVRPCKDINTIPCVDFVMEKIQNLQQPQNQAVVLRETRGKDFIK